MRVSDLFLDFLGKKKRLISTYVVGSQQYKRMCENPYPYCESGSILYKYGVLSMLLIIILITLLLIMRGCAYRNVLGNTLGTSETSWQLEGEHRENTLGTEHPTPTPKHKRKKLSPLEPSHWVHEISISKMFCHHFQPVLISPL